MNVPDRIKELTETFDDNLEAYKKGSYNETQTRREFIDPFFEELGWDIANKKGYAEAYKDVIHEDAIKVGGITKAPDYCFRVGGIRKFFLEAKKPSINIQEDAHPAYQLRRYGWSAKLPLSILTDFEEFAVYDCRVKPVKTDKVPHSRILYLKYTDYVDRWEEIAGIFSKDAILKGSFDRYSESNKIKKGTTEVDAAFLQEIEHWRELLARNIALRNPSLIQRELNFAVQQTIDRIIFLRICEDRGIEPYGGLMALRNGEDVYKRLFNLFHRADEKYNSGLFHFRKEKYRQYCDNLTPFLQIDDKPLKDIFKNLYYPESPYEFSVLSADILGQVYEKFLGKVIRLTAGHQAKIEEKPEVRKAGGVYYTPSYIVDYIVKKTVGKLVEGKKLGPRGGVSRLKILDPACGSGSFLIGAYQFLLDWHLDKYINDGPENWSKGKNPRIYHSQKGEWRLTTDERKRILLNNIYGVDIDHQAVEVTKLSLLLKVLEGEDEQSIGKQISLFQERVLPDLSNNIKCGNSLIGPDFYEHKQISLFDEERIFRINAFDWNTEFAKIMKDGGFDAVIGNPPYVRQESLKEIKTYLAHVYDSAWGTADLYVYFLEKAIRLLREAGYASFIVSSSFLKTTFAKPLRSTLKRNAGVLQLTDFGGLPIFESAKDTYVCIPLFQKAVQPKSITICKINTLEPSERTEQLASTGYSIPHTRFSENEWALRNNEEDALFERLILNNLPLKKVVSGIYYGLKTGYNKAFILAPIEEQKLRDSADKHSVSFLHAAYCGQDIRRYHLRSMQNCIIVIPAGWTRDTYGALGETQAWQCFETDNPALALHLTGHREDLEKRQDKGDYWWELRPCDYYAVLDKEKIIYPDICKSPRFFLDVEGSYIFNTAYAINSNDRYLLGFLNSRLFWWIIAKISIPFGVRAGQFRYRLIYQYMEKVPIRVINFDNPSDVALRDQVVNHVDQMLASHKSLSAAKTPQQINMLQRQIQVTDKQIDQLIYQLYDLTEEEIKIVESES